MTNKIIVADDSQTIQKVIKITFANKNYELIPCLSEGELDSLIADDISLILLDFSLSESKTGYELGKSVSQKYSHIPILALLGTFDTVDEEQFKNAGYSDKVVKPFETEKFITKCAQLIQNGATVVDEIEFNDEVDDADDWGIQSNDSDDSNSTDEEYEVVEENQGRRAVDKLSSDDSLGSELGSWGFEGSDIPVMKDITGEFSEFPPVIEEVSIDEPFASKFLSAENLIDSDDLEEVESHFDEELNTVNETQPNSQVDIQIVDEVQEDDQLDLEPTHPGTEENFWAVDEAYDESDSDEDMGEDENQDSVDQEEEVTREIDLSDFKKELSSPVTDTNDSFNASLEESLKDDLEPLIEKYVHQYCKEHIEKVAWEIIPDLAENLIRKELKDISKTVISSMDN